MKTDSPSIKNILWITNCYPCIKYLKLEFDSEFTFLLQESKQHQQTHPDRVTHPRTRRTTTTTTPRMTARRAIVTPLSLSAKWIPKLWISRQKASSISSLVKSPVVIGSRKANRDSGIILLSKKKSVTLNFLFYNNG